MIARLWRGQTAIATNTEAYFRYLTGTLFPSLKDLAGHHGAWIMRRDVDGRTEFLAMTLWESRQAIEAFAGADIAKAIVEPEARAVLAEFDEFARHYEVAFRTDQAVNS